MRVARAAGEPFITGQSSGREASRFGPLEFEPGHHFLGGHRSGSARSIALVGEVGAQQLAAVPDASNPPTQIVVDSLDGLGVGFGPLEL